MSAPASPELAMVWAQAHGGIIGSGGMMPWHIPEDLAHFKGLTTGSPVVMGRKTWNSLPPKFRPLDGRRNIVVTRDATWAAQGAEVAHSAERALDLAFEDQPATVWIVGGATIYAEFMPRAVRLEVTEINAELTGDTVAPIISDDWTIVAVEPESGWYSSSRGLDYRFLTYRRTDTR